MIQYRIFDFNLSQFTKRNWTVFFNSHDIFSWLSFITINDRTFWTELSCMFVPKSRLVRLWIISVNVVFVKYVNTKDLINRASTAF